MVEYDGDVVVLHPGNGHVSVDGVPITEATRLPQGSRFFMFFKHFAILVNTLLLVV